MKKSIVLLLALLLVVGVNAEVYLPIIAPYQTLSLESFRHIATTSIEDDLDNGIDGTDIFYVKGARVYTNLSNLVSSWETQADNSNSEETVVIGGISDIYKGWRAAAFYGNGNLHESFTGTATEVELENDDGDNAFDWTSVMNSDTSANETENSNCILVNLGRVMGEETELAFTYKRTCSKETGDYTTDRDYTETDIDDAEVDERWIANGTGDGEESVPISLYQLSYAKPFKDWKLRGDVYLYMGGLNNNIDQMFRYFEDYSPWDATLTDDELDTNLVARQDDISGNLAGVSLRLGDVNEYGLWEVGGNFGMVFGSGDYNNTARMHSIYQDQVGSYVEVLDTAASEGTSGPTSVSGMNMGLNGRMEWQISPNVRWGIGLIVNSFSATLEHDLDAVRTVRSVFNDGDTEGSDADDYTLTGVGSFSYLSTIEMTTNSIVVPTGVEVSIGKKKDWFLRLGALAEGSKSQTTQTIDIDEETIQRDSLYIEWGDGSTYWENIDEIAYTDSELTGSTTTQDVYFIYGLGWKPSENLSLDLVGMFDASGVELLSTDWFQSLRLSATINIY